MPTYCEGTLPDGEDCDSVMNDHLALYFEGRALCNDCYRKAVEAHSERMDATVKTLPKRFRKRFES